MANKTPQFLMLARILRPHGVRGDLRVQVVTGFPERMTELDNVYIGPATDGPLSSRTPMSSYRVERAKHDKADNWLLHLHGVDDRESADPLRSLCIFVALEDAVPLEQDEYYLFQLIGLHVVAHDGQPLGKLVDVLETGANDVFVIRGEPLGEVLIPLLDGIIVAVDLPGGVMTVNVPPGLLPENTPE
jgi:16S rRNA processing protein RimM